MIPTEKSIDNSVLSSLMQKAGARVTSAIKTASSKTGVDFAYLMEKAAAESSFDTKAQSKTSSATGLFQFIESTWLGMVKNHGEKYGLGDYAAQISDQCRVSDPALRKEILELRKDPEIASLLAAEFAAGNKDYLEDNLGADYGEIGSTELYFAHFMGAGGAKAFLSALKENPLATAADLFPKAANANRNVFYDRKTGEPRTLAAVYDFFDRKFEDTATAHTPVMMAKAETPVSQDDIVARAREATAQAFLGRDDDRMNALMTLLNTRKDPQAAAVMPSFGQKTVNRGGIPLQGRLSFSEMLITAQLQGTHPLARQN